MNSIQKLSAKSLTLVARLRDDERGLTMVEYAVMAALITAAAVVTIGLVGGQVNTVFNTLLTNLGG